ncbi:MAG TPA: glycosyltransferase family 9 protein [Candidatus Omnitrophota bacterium]|nr:glycosyltransferase family 9 protein [Candidatus Omnitrophota bacterium]
MSEYGLLLASALVSAVVNLLGLARRGPVRRILVVKLDHLGDVITATPALQALREAHPEAEIDLLMAPSVAPLFEGLPFLTRVRTYDSPRYRRAGGDARRRRSPPIPAGARYDVVVELRGDARTLLLPFQVGATRRLDRGTARLRDWIGRRLHPARPPLHEVEANLAIVQPLLGGRASAAGARVQVHVPDAARASLARRHAEAGVSADRPVVALHPGASWAPRAWLPERFAAIADWIEAHYDAQVVIMGSAGERDVEAAVRSHARGSALSWFGTLSIAEAGALLQRCRLLIGNDGGIAHLAAACGTPVAALFGPQDPRRFRPWAERVVALHHRVPCFPCSQVRCVRPELPCVNLIEIAEVEAAARALLGPPPLRS